MQNCTCFKNHSKSLQNIANVDPVWRLNVRIYLLEYLVLRGRRYITSTYTTKTLCFANWSYSTKNQKPLPLSGSVNFESGSKSGRKCEPPHASKIEHRWKINHWRSLKIVAIISPAWCLKVRIFYWKAVLNSYMQQSTAKKSLLIANSKQEETTSAVRLREFRIWVELKTNMRIRRQLREHRRHCQDIKFKIS